jgi:AdoMet-dependent heme synthase
LADVLALLRHTGVNIWEVFFLVGVGRGVDVREVSPRDAEDVCHFLVDASHTGMTVRTVEGPFFRRVQAQRAADPSDPLKAGDVGALYRHLRARSDFADLEPTRASHSGTLATGDGRGVVFVGFDGEVHASGFLPLALGNVKSTPLGEIYAHNELLTEIRAGHLTGACGVCEYSRLCGGSRARAFTTGGDALGEDPSCLVTLGTSR